MEVISNFAKRIDEHLAEAGFMEPQVMSDAAKRYLVDVGERRRQFEQIATSVVGDIIHPRMELVAQKFLNARLAQGEPADCCSCWFNYCERCPARTRVAFSVGYSIFFENVSVRFETHMTPLLVEIDICDRFVISLDAVKHAQIVEWVEERLREFLEMYLTIDFASEYFDERTVSDPVCGARIQRSPTTVISVHRERTYCFCSDKCQIEFARDSSTYA